MHIVALTHVARRFRCHVVSVTFLSAGKKSFEVTRIRRFYSTRFVGQLPVVRKCLKSHAPPEEDSFFSRLMNNELPHGVAAVPHVTSIHSCSAPDMDTCCLVSSRNGQKNGAGVLAFKRKAVTYIALGISLCLAVVFLSLHCLDLFEMQPHSARMQQAVIIRTFCGGR